MSDHVLSQPPGWPLAWSDEFDGAPGSPADPAPDSSTALPQTMLIDHIRVYTRAATAALVHEHEVV